MLLTSCKSGILIFPFFFCYRTYGFRRGASARILDCEMNNSLIYCMEHFFAMCLVAQIEGVLLNASILEENCTAL
uniref:Putative secreted protein salivary gland overexpressed n=1 Tax=Rhipicephalus microplus TaxID=6941 RepID=A0A6M2DB95_RHIMP